MRHCVVFFLVVALYVMISSSSNTEYSNAFNNANSEMYASINTTTFVPAKTIIKCDAVEPYMNYNTIAYNDTTIHIMSNSIKHNVYYKCIIDMPEGFIPKLTFSYNEDNNHNPPYVIKRNNFKLFTYVIYDATSYEILYRGKISDSNYRNRHNNVHFPLINMLTVKHKKIILMIRMRKYCHNNYHSINYYKLTNIVIGVDALFLPELTKTHQTPKPSLVITPILLICICVFICVCICKVFVTLL